MYQGVLDKHLIEALAAVVEHLFGFGVTLIDLLLEKLLAELEHAKAQLKPVRYRVVEARRIVVVVVNFVVAAAVRVVVC